MKKSGRSFLSVLGGLFFFIFLRVDSWLCSLPAWLTLILHFTVGLSIWWFWGTLFVWIAAGILRYLLILFGRWGASSDEPDKPNRNPYSVKSTSRKENDGGSLSSETVDEKRDPAGVYEEKEEEAPGSFTTDGTSVQDRTGNSLH